MARLRVLPGAAVGIVLKDGTAFAVTTGVGDRAAKTPVKPDDLFMAGSTGKTFFAAVAVQLIEAGKLDLDAPISKYLGDAPVVRPAAECEGHHRPAC